MKQERLQYLDGLRGVACLMVVAWHCWQFFSPGPHVDLKDTAEAAVSVFFVMSGLVLVPWAKSGNPFKLLFSRWLRLLVPCFFAMLFANMLADLYVQKSISGEPLAPSGRFLSSLVGLFVGFSGATLLPLPRDLSGPILCGQLWTISFELAGSMMVLALIRLRRTPHWQLLAYVCCLGLFGLHEFGLFAFGTLMSLFKNKPREGVAIACLWLAVVLIMSPWQIKALVSSAFLGTWNYASPMTGAGAVAGLLIMVAVTFSSVIQKVLIYRPILWIGGFSFPIYLLHLQVLSLIGPIMYAGGASASSICVAVMAMTILIAVAFERLIDRPAIAISRVIRRA